jgi:hypothetical protein
MQASDDRFQAVRMFHPDCSEAYGWLFKKKSIRMHGNMNVKYTASISKVEDDGSNLYQSTRFHSPDDTVQSHRRRNHKLHGTFLMFFWKFFI